MKKDKDNIIMTVSLALSLPSSILAIFYFVYYLIEKNIISETLGLGIIVTSIISILVMMVKYASKR